MFAVSTRSGSSRFSPLLLLFHPFYAIALMLFILLLTLGGSGGMLMLVLSTPLIRVLIARGGETGGFKYKETTGFGSYSGKPYYHGGTGEFPQYRPQVPVRSQSGNNS
jgi:hypothetical protein